MKELDYNIAYRAVHGSRTAQKQIIEQYEGYINAIATVEEHNADGSSSFYIDEDIKAAITEELLRELPKCKVMKY